eukprot:7280391-Alexandrium_andersonii.AAC.1
MEVLLMVLLAWQPRHESHDGAGFCTSRAFWLRTASKGAHMPIHTARTKLRVLPTSAGPTGRSALHDNI